MVKAGVESQSIFLKVNLLIIMDPIHISNTQAGPGRLGDNAKALQSFHALVDQHNAWYQLFKKALDCC